VFPREEDGKAGGRGTGADYLPTMRKGEHDASMLGRGKLD